VTDRPCIHKWSLCDYQLPSSSFPVLCVSDLFKVLQNKICLRFEVLGMVSMKIAIFWSVTPHSLIDSYLHFRGMCLLKERCRYQEGRSRTRAAGRSLGDSGPRISFGPCTDCYLSLVYSQPQFLSPIPVFSHLSYSSTLKV
jgi:hypothetical protein